MEPLRSICFANSLTAAASPTITVLNPQRPPPKGPAVHHPGELALWRKPGSSRHPHTPQFSSQLSWFWYPHNTWKAQGTMSWAGGGGEARGSTHTYSLHCGQTPRTLEPVHRTPHSSHQPGLTVPAHGPGFTRKWTAGFALKPLDAADSPDPQQGSNAKDLKEGKTFVKTEMSSQYRWGTDMSSQYRWLQNRIGDQ